MHVSWKNVSPLFSPLSPEQHGHGFFRSRHYPNAELESFSLFFRATPYQICDDVFLIADSALGPWPRRGYMPLWRLSLYLCWYWAQGNDDRRCNKTPLRMNDAIDDDDDDDDLTQRWPFCCSR